jgi:cytochrome c oxidase subunit 2
MANSVIKALAGVSLATLPAIATAQNQVNMAKGVTELGGQIYELHMLILWICVVIGLRRCSA